MGDLILRQRKRRTPLATAASPTVSSIYIYNTVSLSEEPTHTNLGYVRADRLRMETYILALV